MEDTSKIVIGQYVKSTQGRDKNYLFVVIDIIDDKMVKVVDGDLRKVDNPKTKNIKHIKKINKVSENIQNQVINEKKLTNLMVKQEIMKIGMSNTQKGGE